MRAPEITPLFPKLNPLDLWRPESPGAEGVAAWWITRDGTDAELPREFDGCESIAHLEATTAREQHYRDGTHDDYTTHFYCRGRRAWRLAWRLARMIARNDGWIAVILRRLPRTEGLYIEPGLHHRILQLDGAPVLALPAPRKEAA